MMHRTTTAERRKGETAAGGASDFPAPSTAPIYTEQNCAKEKMVKPIPDNIKEVLSQLSGPQQVALRGYIATLRADIKGLEEELLAARDEDSHAHYHGHEKCTADHGHEHSSHGKEEGEGEHAHHSHEHSSHGKEGHGEHAHHSHVHHDHHKEHSHHDHHTHHDHHHHENAKKEESAEMPAWKKKAMEQGATDPTAAPFGGSWTTEAQANAKSDDKMQE
jgi:hypothetical protein